jgi:prepilin-type N-terminal cleavage/methylation domain-containing protein
MTRTTSSSPGRPRGYTLAEFLIASAVISMVMVAVISVQMQGVGMLRTGTVRTWALRRALHASDQMGTVIREARDCAIFPNYRPAPSVTNGVTEGDMLYAWGYGWTSSLYRIGETLYISNQAAGQQILAGGVRPQTMFCLSNQCVEVMLEFVDPRDHASVLVDACAGYRPRNKR